MNQNECVINMNSEIYKKKDIRKKTVTNINLIVLKMFRSSTAVNMLREDIRWKTIFSSRIDDNE